MNKARHTAEENDNDKFEEMLEQERRDEAMRENKEHEEEQREERPDWDMDERGYL
jgi:hypothetical protein